ncbi:MAG: hypothetical protein RIR79_595 [Pseudomonadota bacterium]|jgi:hypothetical protein
MTKSNMNWVEESLKLFKMERPDHFTHYNHCHDCYDNDVMFRRQTIESIGMKELGNYLGFEPLHYCTAEGKRYFTPALIRLTLETVDTEFYFYQFAYHLQNEEYYLACTPEQRSFMASFILYMIEQYTIKLDDEGCDEFVLNAYELWKGSDNKKTAPCAKTQGG